MTDDGNSSRRGFLGGGAIIPIALAGSLDPSVRPNPAGQERPPADLGEASFLQSGRGSVRRRLESKLQDHVSIKDFGAVCDGVTDDTAAIHAAMNASDNVLVPGHTRANIVWPRQGVRLFGNGVGEFHPTAFTYQRGTLMEAHDPLRPVITVNPDTVGQNLNHIAIENMCVAGVARVGDGIAVLKTSGRHKVADLVIRNVSTRACLTGLRIDCEVLWATFDHLTHDFCHDGCRIVTDEFVNGLVAGMWAARRCYRHGFFWSKTDVTSSGFQAWNIDVLSSDYNGDFNSTGVRQAGVIGVYIRNFEGLTINELVAEGNGLDQPAGDGHGVLLEGVVNRSIKILSAAIVQSPLPFRWKGGGASGQLDNFYRFSSSKGETAGIISAEHAIGDDGTGGGPRIRLGKNFAEEMRSVMDARSGGYPTDPGMDYIPALGSILNLAHRDAATINASLSSKTISRLRLPGIGRMITLANYAGATTNTVTLDGALMGDAISRVIPANEARTYIVSGFPIEGKLVDIGPPCRQGTAYFDPGRLDHGGSISTSIVVAGAVLGDFAEVSFSLDLQGLTVTAWVSAADQVTVQFRNETSGPLDPGAGDLRVRTRSA